MRPESTRREMLAAVGGGSMALAGCSALDFQSSDRGLEVDPVEHDRLVGAYYYPWYEQSVGWQDWLEMVPGEPALGEYSSADRDVINQHVKWAREHGINWFNVSWAGPAGERAGFHDRVLKDEFLQAALGDRIQFSLLYESNLQFETYDGGLMDLDDPANRETLRTDFEYLEETYFDEPTYLRMDGRPVVTMYTAHDFRGAVREAFREATNAIDADPYLVASVLGGGSPAGLLNGVDSAWTRDFDAATAYNLYDASVAENGDFMDFVDYADRTTRKWALASEHMDVDFIPNVIPGYDDSLVPGRDRPSIERDPEGFRELADTVSHWMDPDLDAVLVTSFNEWPEYTSVEPAESYGTTYLEIIEEELATAEPDPVDVSAYPALQLRFDRTLPPPEEPGLAFAMQLGELALTDGAGETVRSYDVGVPEAEPYMLEGAYDPPKRGGPLGTWRWLGGDTARSTICLDPECRSATTARLLGMAPSFADGPVGVGVYFEGARTDRIEVDPGPATHVVSLTTEA